MLKQLAICVGLVCAGTVAWADAKSDCAQGQDQDRRIKGCTQYIQLNPPDKKDLAIAHHNRAAAYLSKGDGNSAITDYTKAIEIDSKYASAYTNRSAAYFKQGDYERAIADAKKAIEIEPSAIRYNNRGAAYREKGAYGEAIADFTKAIAMEPTANRYVTRAVAYEKKGDRDNAIADFRRAQAKDPNNQGSKEGLKRLGASP